MISLKGVPAASLITFLIVSIDSILGFIPLAFFSSLTLLYVIRIINPTATDGTQTAIGAIVSDVNATENAKAVIITRSAMLADYAVVWPANITKEQKNAAIKPLEARGIIVRKGV
ncbi:head decoration protein [Wolbachia endosymbiont of Spodoptera picta]|nr:head decoration protein [Wolbachia endosymbiont of Spodoptera picta]